MIFNRKLSQLIPYFLVNSLFFGFFALILSYLYALNSGSWPKGILYFVVFFIMEWTGSILYAFYRAKFLIYCFRVGHFELYEDGLKYVDRKGDATIFIWSGVSRMKFKSGSFYGMIEYFGGRKFGYYVLISNDGRKIYIPPTVENQEDLLREIIQRAGLAKKESKNLIEYNFMGAHYAEWVRSDSTDAVMETDISTSPRKISSLRQWIIAFLGILVVFMLVQIISSYYLQNDYFWEWF